jgi:phosphoribosylanthranilate isomerase
LFRIKICGVTTLKDTQLIALAGADAIGLNFFPDSPRFVESSAAEVIVASISAKLERVGVFVNAPVEFIKETAGRLKLDWVQLHGDETPETVAALSGIRVLKAFRIGAEGWQPIVDFLNECQTRGNMPAALLLDASRPGEYGGTGQTLDWEAVRNARSHFAGLPVVLAGGLTPFNVSEAISTAKPDAVDVASGVESKPGTKDLMLIRAFVMGAKKAFAAASG